MHSKKWDGLPLVIFGSGGTSKEVAFFVREINRNAKNKIFNLLGFVESDCNLVGKGVDNMKIISCDKEFSEFASSFPLLGVVLPLGTPKLKKRIFDKILFEIPNIVYPNLIYPSVNFDEINVEIGYGNIIAAGVNLTTDIKIGNFNLFNSNTTVGHDTVIDSYCVINPLASISGNVLLEDEILIGTGANVLQGLKIGSQSTIGAGAVVTKNVKPGSTMVGMPARNLIKDKMK